jgi:lysophospholipase L1-like esterase
MNNARVTWFPLVCAALDCEYGQLGTGGQGMVRTNLQIPPLPETWDHYDATTSRLSAGLLQPEPDYVFCAMGTNDFEEKDKVFKHMNITAAYTGWLAAVRKASPHAAIFCVTPPLGWHASEVGEAVAARRRDGDPQIYLIDTAPLKGGFRAGDGATRLACDGVHPSVYGNAMLATLIVAEAQKALCAGH